MKKCTLLLVIFALTAVYADGQFNIKIPKVKKPKIETPKTDDPVQKADPLEKAASKEAEGVAARPSNRQMVMDDAATFFDAEPVKEYDEKIHLDKDVGWYLKSSLRILGTFPKRSAFRIAVKKNGNELASTRCEGNVYTKEGDIYLRTPQSRKMRDLNYEDFMTTGYRCFDEKAVIREIGNLDVEIYLIDGDTDKETLVRKHKIDVHRATKVRGLPAKPQPDVSDYYIQRHSEASVAFAFFIQNNQENPSYFKNPINQLGSPTYGDLYIYTTYSPDEQTRLPSNPFVRCTVDGQKLNLPRDDIRMNEDQGRREIGIYIDRIAPKYKTGPPYKDPVEFVGLVFKLPVFTGEGEYSKPPMKIEDHPGKWECSVVANGVTYRTFRWTVDSNGIVPHPEQNNGNVNLFYKAALIEMEIPAGGSPNDYRLMPMPEAGLFYGVPWSTPEGKAMAAKVPKKGNPFEIPSSRAK
ncbi:MAG: hypothetical protein R2747_23935 [Pyrinomonadaceae bacterium]